MQIALNSSLFGIPLAEQCRKLCCTTTGCAFWTVTDPQPSSTEHICWLKNSDGALVENGCAHYSSGHCWSGAVRRRLRVARVSAFCAFPLCSSAPVLPFALRGTVACMV